MTEGTVAKIYDGGKHKVNMEITKENKAVSIVFMEYKYLLEKIIPKAEKGIAITCLYNANYQPASSAMKPFETTSQVSL